MKTLPLSEINKINGILVMTKEEIEKTKKQFSSIHKISEDKVIIKDWLDDSIQLVTIK